MPPMKRLAGKTMEHDIARARVYLKPAAAGGGDSIYFVPCVGGFNAAGLPLTLGRPAGGFRAGLYQDSTVISYGYGYGVATATSLTAYAVINGFGDTTCQNEAFTATPNDDLATTDFDSGIVTVEGLNDEPFYKLLPLSLSVSIGDMIQFYFTRIGSNPADTGSYNMLYGWLVYQA